MTLNDGFDRTVSDWLDEQAGRGSPGYLDEVLDPDDPDPTAAVVVEPRKVALRAIDSSLRTGSQDGLAPRRPRSHRRPRYRDPRRRLAETDRRLRSVRAPRGHVLYAAADGDIYAHRHCDECQRGPLSPDRPTDSGPLISPDGTSFAFVRRDAGSSSTSIVLANADGSGLREITGAAGGGRRDGPGHRTGPSSRSSGVRACGSSGQTCRPRW